MYLYAVDVKKVQMASTAKKGSTKPSTATGFCWAVSIAIVLSARKFSCFDAGHHAYSCASTRLILLSDINSVSCQA